MLEKLYCTTPEDVIISFSLSLSLSLARLLAHSPLKIRDLLLPDYGRSLKSIFATFNHHSIWFDFR